VCEQVGVHLGPVPGAGHAEQSELGDTIEAIMLAVRAWVLRFGPGPVGPWQRAVWLTGGLLSGSTRPPARNGASMPDSSGAQHKLTAQGLAPSSIAQRVSAVRRLAATLGADPLVQQVRCSQVQRDEPRALSDAEP
jgi:hypothetical protein